MGRVKIKHRTLRDRNTKQKLLQILSSKEVYPTNLLEANDGYIVLTSTDTESDKIFSRDCLSLLGDSGFTPILPTELKCRRGILLFRLDDIIYNNNIEEIKEELEKSNAWMKDEISIIYKFPKANIVKITMNSANAAHKATQTGLLMYNLRVTQNQIQREIFIPIITCLRCYEMEGHTTNQCPKPKTFKICSTCSVEGHIWKECRSGNKKCINCKEGHGTMEMKCKLRKKIVSEKRKLNTTQSTTKDQNQADDFRTGASYSGATRRTTNTSAPVNFAAGHNTPTLILQCMIHAHLVNIGTPGSYEKELNNLLKVNNLPVMKIPTNPPSERIIELGAFRPNPTNEQKQQQQSRPRQEQLPRQMNQNQEEVRQHQCQETTISSLEGEIDSMWEEYSHTTETVKATPTTQTENNTEEATERETDLGLVLVTRHSTGWPPKDITTADSMSGIERGKYKWTHNNNVTDEYAYNKLKEVNPEDIYWKKVSDYDFRKIRSGQSNERSPRLDTKRMNNHTHNA